MEANKHDRIESHNQISSQQQNPLHTKNTGEFAKSSVNQFAQTQSRKHHQIDECQDESADNNLKFIQNQSLMLMEPLGISVFSDISKNDKSSINNHSSMIFYLNQSDYLDEKLNDHSDEKLRYNSVNLKNNKFSTLQPFDSHENRKRRLTGAFVPISARKKPTIVERIDNGLENDICKIKDSENPNIKGYEAKGGLINSIEFSPRRKGNLIENYPGTFENVDTTRFGKNLFVKNLLKYKQPNGTAQF